MTTHLRHRILKTIKHPKPEWQIALEVRTLANPVTPQEVLSALIDLERDNRARQVGKNWQRIGAGPVRIVKPAKKSQPAARLVAYSVFNQGA